jgi:hypothetical protein
MALSNPQRRFIDLMQQNAERVAKAVAGAEEVVRVFEDREYATSGNVTDEDLAEFDIVLADIGAYINACHQLVNWRDNLAVTPGEWGKATNVVRTLFL